MHKVPSNLVIFHHTYIRVYLSALFSQNSILAFLLHCVRCAKGLRGWLVGLKHVTLLANMRWKLLTCVTRDVAFLLTRRPRPAAPHTHTDYHFRKRFQ